MTMSTTWPEETRLCCGGHEGSFDLVVTGEREVRVEPGASGLRVLAAGRTVSPYHLMAGSLGICTAMTVGGWAERAGLDAEGLTITVRWTTAEERPARVDRYEIEMHWPTLPAERARAAERAADGCPIHATLETAVRIFRCVRTESGRTVAG
jgi:uncharacterized OsmC-like protein